MPFNLSITHLYPNHLNLYGDLGNIIALKRRCQWLGIDYQVNQWDLNDVVQAGETDIYFMGGGQDKDQLAVVDDFHALKRAAVTEDTLDGVVFLGVCGGYQLMGNSFLMGNGNSTRGLGIINIETKAPGTSVKQRCTGNLVVEIMPDIYADMRSLYTSPSASASPSPSASPPPSPSASPPPAQSDTASPPTVPKTLVGFENHSGQTYLGQNVAPLARTIAGFGNNADAVYEGARFKNVFGSYMHGSLLPKNPHFADYLIWLALVRKYNDPDIRLPHLTDQEELDAHHYIVKRYTQQYAGPT
ncbi:MAG: glutamine amidotransferase [Cyanobacteria bacterium P01_F01_bin.150]